MGAKKTTKSYNAAKQHVKDKFNKSNSIDTEQTKYTKERLHLMKWILKHTKPAGHDYLRKIDSLSDKGMAFSVVITALGDSGIVDSAVGDSYGAIGTTIKDTSMSMKSISRFTTEHILTPLTTLYEADAKQVLELKRKHEHARLHYESSQAKVNEYQRKANKKLPEAEHELVQAKASYEHLTEALEAQSNIFFNTMNERLLPLVQTYAQTQVEFYTQLAEQWRDTTERIANIAKAPREPAGPRKSARYEIPSDPIPPTQPPAQAVKQTTEKRSSTKHDTKSTQNGAEKYQDGNPFEPVPQSRSRSVSQPPMPQHPSVAQNIQPPSQTLQPAQTRARSTSQPPMPDYPSQIMPTQHQQTGTSNKSQLPPQPSMQNFGELAPKSNNRTVAPNYYPEHNDPFHKDMASRKAPFMQPQPKNVYSR